MTVKRFHGKEPRGIDLIPKSTSYEGRFGRMFRPLPAAKHAIEDLKKLAASMVAEPEDPPAGEDEVDGEENQAIDAGYTYFGQFLDHDLTFDPASSLQKQNDPDGLVDFRTPRFDLDSVYGRGPDDQPYIYDSDGLHMLLGRRLAGHPNDPHTRDLPRNNPATGPRRALIGDPRNDENVIVSQLHAVFLRFHNRLANIMSKGGVNVGFEEIQQQVRWHFQWVIMDDFLRTIVGEKTLYDVLPHLKSGKAPNIDKPRLEYYHWKNDPYMPVEFSVAAYRFGHSMIRPIYRLNTTLTARQMIFGAEESETLVGFREFNENWAIDWNLFFNPGGAVIVGKNRIQKAYKIDTSLVNPLGNLPKPVAREIASLAERNLLRGLRMGLPSGQSVARQMLIPVIPDKKLKVGKATEEDSESNILLTDISAKFKNNAPLWYYILAEAQQQFVLDSNPIVLGPVGGRIVAEVFAGMLLADSHSFLVQDPTWKPMPEFMKKGRFRILDLITQAMKDNDPV